MVNAFTSRPVGSPVYALQVILGNIVRRQSIIDAREQSIANAIEIMELANMMDLAYVNQVGVALAVMFQQVHQLHPGAHQFNV